MKSTKELELSIEEQLKYSYCYPFLKILGSSSNILDGKERHINFCKKIFQRTEIYLNLLFF